MKILVCFVFAIIIIIANFADNINTVSAAPPDMPIGATGGFLLSTVWQAEKQFYYNSQGWQMSTRSYNEMIAERDRILQQTITEDMTEFEKLRAVHKWLVENVSYNENAWSWWHFEHTGSGWNPNFRHVRYPMEHQMAWSALILRTTVCAGYADALVYLLEPLGIEALFVLGDVYAENGTSFAHAWNLVRLDENWYHLDASWNRFYFNGVPVVTYNWFLLSDFAMRRGQGMPRTWDEIDLPEALVSYNFEEVRLVFDRRMWRWVLR